MHGPTKRGMVVVAAIIVMAGGLAAACGGGGGGKSYSPSATANCLRSKGASVDPGNTDYIAQANRGYYVSGLPDSGAVNVSFGNVSQIKSAYQPFMSSGNKLDSTGNTVLAWDTFSSAADSEVRGCLQ